MRNIFVDATAWVALFDPKDRNHRKAAEFWSTLKEPSKPIRFSTSDYVLDEAYTLLKVHVNPKSSLLLHQIVSESALTTVNFVGKKTYDEAWKIFSGYEDKKWSFTDCTSYILMKGDRIDEVFAFDDHFRQMGFIMLPREAEG